MLPALTAGIQNQGLNNYVPQHGATVLRDVISISANGANTGATFYQSHDFTVLQDAYAIRWRRPGHKPNARQQLFLTAAITKTIYGTYEWTNKAGWTKVQHECISLPLTPAGDIDFGFMERTIAELEAERIAELEAYLQAAGLENCELTPEERKAVAELQHRAWGHFNLCALFGKSTRGKRLKGDDRVPGTLPFVTAGEAQEGVSAFIGNTVEVFLPNTITIDMFGSAKYRNYVYGGDDHIAVVHTESLPKHAAIFTTAAIHKAAHNGQFDYSRNFYAKDADALNIRLPLTAAGTPDTDYMCILTRAVEKLVVTGVASFTRHRVEATRTAAARENTYTLPAPQVIARAAESGNTTG